MSDLSKALWSIAQVAPESTNVTTLRPEVKDLLIEAADRIAELEEALAFYADAETYHAVAFLADTPCGEFMDDFSEDHGDEYGRPMPGKLARSKLVPEKG